METLLHFYQNLPSYISPEIFSIGPFSVRWYSLGYIFAFTTLTIYLLYSVRKGALNFKFNDNDVYDLCLYVFFGTLIGGRIGYALFYQFSYYFFHPLEIILPIKATSNGYEFVGFAGMSYHGGVLGLLAGFWLFSRLRKVSALNLIDVSVVPMALGYTFGRLGNFMNGELYGRETDFITGMYFLNHDGTVFWALRHPSQLYEAFFEGIVTFAILFSLRNRRLPAGTLGALYLFLYGFFRFFIEFLRQPDSHFATSENELGTVLYNLSMGQVLCLVMVIASIVLFYVFRRMNVPSLIYFRKVKVNNAERSETVYKAKHGKQKKKKKKK